MSYTALYRKFRPNTFEDVKGQDHIVTTLKNQIKADRIGHAYLFCGTRGTGKTTIAKIFARSVNCENPVDGSPCGECPTCKAIAVGASMNVIEIDAASNNGVDNIREIVDEVSYSPTEGKYKVYIIDEVHMLSIGAFNALLKTLEEPPSYVIFILATTEAHKLPITILSRCQRYDFKRITIETIVERMKELVASENVRIEEKALRYIGKAADGSMRDALSLLDQCIAFNFGEELTYDKVLNVLGAVDTGVFSDLLGFVTSKNILGAIELLEQIVIRGRELTQFVTDFTWYLRNLLLVKTSGNQEGQFTLEDIIDASTDTMQRFREEAESIDADTIMRYIRIFSELSGQIKYASQKRVLIEMTIIKLCKPNMETDFTSMLERIRDIEMQLERGIVVSGNGVMPQSNPVALAERPPLPKAIPEDVKVAVERWGSITNHADQPMKTYLRNAKLSLGGDNKLMVVLEDGIASDYFIKEPENKTRLEALVSDTIEKEVSVTIQSIEQGRSFEDSYADLSQLINMDIDEEEE
ncbi:MAG: DNA polymerase III subunit gamma/tau [Lachnospiraceae bacterium]|nr:DNA polymerase III subunit gamma/tau [Lachnospiraceae bacterium]